MHWSVTWEKALFIALIAGLFFGFFKRRNRKLHVRTMATSIVGLLLLFCWIVVQRFVFPHAPGPAKPLEYWVLFGTHVITGLIVVILAGLQGVSGGLLLGRGTPEARKFHKRCGILTIVFAIISLLSVIPI